MKRSLVEDTENPRKKICKKFARNVVNSSINNIKNRKRISDAKYQLEHEPPKKKI